MVMRRKFADFFFNFFTTLHYIVNLKSTVGIYYWSKGSDYVKYAEQMIENNIRVNNEFYVCPVFNEAIKDGKNIKVFDVPRMWGLGTPEDLKYYVDNFS